MIDSAWEALLYILIGLLIIFTIVLAILYLKENRIFYTPHKPANPTLPPDNYTATHMLANDSVMVTLLNIEIITEDGVVLRGYHISPSNNLATQTRRKRFI